jgi:hypothetical protein
MRGEAQRGSLFYSESSVPRLRLSSSEAGKKRTTPNFMLITKYKRQKKSAEKRGIEFILTYNDWLAIWMKSGKLDKRGRHKGNYVMCRKNDSGPYAVGNVFIATTSDNVKEAHKTKREKIQAKDLLIASLKQKLWIKTLNSPEWKEKEKKRQDKLNRKIHFKERFNKVLYNGENPRSISKNSTGRFASFRK